MAALLPAGRREQTRTSQPSEPVGMSLRHPGCAAIACAFVPMMSGFGYDCAQKAKGALHYGADSYEVRVGRFGRYFWTNTAADDLRSPIQARQLTELTMTSVVSISANPAADTVVFTGYPPAGALTMTIKTDGTVKVGIHDYLGGDVMKYFTTTPTVPVGKLVVITATVTVSKTLSVFFNGLLAFSQASAVSSFLYGSAPLPGPGPRGYNDAVYNGSTVEVYGVLANFAALPDKVVEGIGNAPWQLFAPIQEPRLISLPIGGGGAAALAGAAATGASATGSLSTAIPILGAAVSGATANGSLSTAISLAGATATISATATGDLSATIRLAGDAVAAALAAGGLSTGIPLAGGGSVGGAGTGDLSTGSGLAGAGAAGAAGTGVLTTQITLSGAAIAQAIASGALTTTPSGLAGDGTSSSSGSGALSTAIPLAGAAAVSVVGTGGLVTAIPLAGASTVAVSATGDLVVSLGLAGAALVSAIGSGALLTSITFSGAGLASALASGALTTVAVLAVDMPVTARIGTRFAARLTRIGSRYANGSRRIGARRTARG